MPGVAYRPEIDGLRAVAVIAVVLYHADARLLPGGFVGVDVFFVISGYLITALLAAELHGTGRIDLAGFYARRIRRLMPALWVMMLAVLVGAALVLPQVGGQVYRITDSALASLLLQANFHFQAATGNYFDGPAERMPLLHLWSLAVEEQYYLVYPLMLWLLMARPGRRPAFALCLCSLGSLALAEHLLQVDPDSAFYRMPARFWELAAGGLVALSVAGRLPGRMPAWLQAAGLALIVFACVATPQSPAFPGVHALPPVLGAVLIVLGVHSGDTRGPVGILLRSRPLVFIGLISYPFYLWHWPLLAFDRIVTLDGSPLVGRLALCLLALLLAWTTWRWVELPVRNLRRLAPTRVFALSGLALAVMAAATAGLGMMNLSAGDVAALVKRTRDDRPANMAYCHVALHSHVNQLVSSTCASAPGQAPTVAVWGDSHALAWQPFAFRLAAARGEVAIGYTMDACPPMLGYSHERADFPSHSENCARFNDLAVEHLAEGGFNTVVIAARWLPHFPVEPPPGPDSPSSGGRMPADALVRGLDRALDRLHGVPTIILIGPIPQLSHDATECIGLGRLADCESSRASFLLASSLARRELGLMASRHRNVVLVDPTDHFCDQERCSVMKGGRSMFWDDDHVASSTALAFADEYLAKPSRYTSSSFVNEAAQQ